MSSSFRKIGPIIGGLLARPADRFPHLFGDNDFLKKYPYFLPCAIPATFTILAWFIAFFFLKETLAHPRPAAEYFGIGQPKGDEHVDHTMYHGLRAHSDDDVPHSEKPLSIQNLLRNKYVMFAAVNNATLSLVDIAFRAIHPLFLATPIEFGGLGLPPSTIGKILSFSGILNGVFQLFFFAKIHDRWGSKRTFITGIAFLFPSFALFPIINLLARNQGYSSAVWFAVIVQVMASIVLGISFGKASY